MTLVQVQKTMPSLFKTRKIEAHFKNRPRVLKTLHVNESPAFPNTLGRRTRKNANYFFVVKSLILDCGSGGPLI